MGIRSYIVAALLAGMLAVAVPVGARADALYPLRIERQPLHTALQAFSIQTGLQIGHLDPPGARKLVVGPIEGEFTAEAALGKLLAGSSFTFKRVNANTFALIVQPMPPAPRPRLKTQRAAGSNRLAKQPAAEPSGDPAPIDGVTVTGSRLRNNGVTPSPVTVFGREWIDSLGLSTVGELLRYVPQQPYAQLEFIFNGSEHAELRGIDRGTTLVLINGRRTTATSLSVVNGAFDINTLPLAVVDHVEVLSDPATAVYGADAMGGVFNIVLKQDIDEPIISVRYGGAEGGADERRISLIAGDTSERVRGSVVLDYFEREPLLGAERERTGNQDYRRYGSADIRSPQSNPANIRSLTGAPLPGLSSSTAAVPVGSSGIGLTPADFARTAGQQNLTSGASYLSILPHMRHASVALHGEFQFAPRLSTFGELFYTRREADTQLAPIPLFDAVVPASNAFNPFQVPVAVNYLLTGIGPQQLQSELDTLRALGGLRGTIKTWDWEISVLRTEGGETQRFEGAVEPAQIAMALASSDPATALNVFQDGPGGSPAFLHSLLAASDMRSVSTEATQGLGFLRGSLPLPTSDMEIAVGAEWRQEGIQLRTPGIQAPSLRQALKRSVSSLFGEVRLSLLDGLTAEEDVLSLVLAGRLDSYDDSGDAFNPQYGMVWRPLADWTLRASYGTSFRPANLFDLSEPRDVQPFVIPDPRRHNEIVSVPVLFGGNPDLDAVEARSLSGGFIYQPMAVEGLRVEATYWRTKVQNRVVQPSTITFLANEELFSDRLMRAEPTAADIAAGVPGQLRFIDITKINHGWLDTRGMDVELSYAIDTQFGEWTPRLAATWVDKFEDFPGTTSRINRVGLADPRGTIPRWRAVATIGWERQALSISGAARYVASYEDTNRTIVTGRTVAAELLIDAQVSYNFGDFAPTAAVLPGVTLTAGVVNLFNREPGFSEASQFLGVDTSLASLRQRFGYLRLSKAF